MNVLLGVTKIDLQQSGQECLELHRTMLEVLDLRAKVATLEKDSSGPGHKALNRRLNPPAQK